LTERPFIGRMAAGPMPPGSRPRRAAGRHRADGLDEARSQVIPFSRGLPWPFVGWSVRSGLQVAAEVADVTRGRRRERRAAW
jgi:hypothetical protein